MPDQHCPGSLLVNAGGKTTGTCNPRQTHWEGTLALDISDVESHAP